MVDLDTRLLRAFVAVSTELNFTRAGERLFIAQQALSSQVQQLERRLGVKLFERTTRRVALTAAGEQFLAWVGERLPAACARPRGCACGARRTRQEGAGAGGASSADRALGRLAPELLEPVEVAR